MEAAACQGITKGGRACRANAQVGRRYCYTHDPDREAERAESRRRGGLAKAADVRASKTWVRAGSSIDVETMPRMLLGMVESVASGELEPSQAMAIANVIKVALQVDGHLHWQRRTREIEDLLARLETIR